MKPRNLPALIAFLLALGIGTARADDEIHAITKAVGGYLRLSQALIQPHTSQVSVISLDRAAPSLSIDRSIISSAQAATPPLPLKPLPYEAEITKAAQRHGIRPEFLLAVIKAESAFDPMALSPKGARGLGQIMPATAADLGIRPHQLWSPAINADASARYLRWLGERYDWDRTRMLIGYNAGPAVADGGRPIPSETRVYLIRVDAAYRQFLIRNQAMGGQK